VFESHNFTQCEKIDLKIIQSLLERFQISKWCWKTEGPEGLFWRKVLLNCSTNQGTQEQPSQNKTKTSRGSSR